MVVIFQLCFHVLGSLEIKGHGLRMLLPHDLNDDNKVALDV